jgi:hypothetical protein
MNEAETRTRVAKMEDGVCTYSLMEHQRVMKGRNACPEVGEMMLVVGEEKNRA